MSHTRSIPRGAIKIPLPDTEQCTGYTCGPSCVQAVCTYYGVGTSDETEYTRIMHVRSSVGAHPHNVIAALRYYGLRWRERWPMSLDKLRGYLDRRIPVLLMIQAWPSPRKLHSARFRRGGGYASEWNEGHWVVAIGHDRRYIYLEDPSLVGSRGYLADDELLRRWHDVGPGWRPKSRGQARRYQRHMQQYGIAVWRPRGLVPKYTARAAHID